MAKRLLAGVAVTAAVGSLAGGAWAAGSFGGDQVGRDSVAGPQSATTGITPHGWSLTPAGNQIELGDKPFAGTLSPDHRFLVVSNDGQGPQSLQVIETATGKTVQTLTYNAPESLFVGAAFSPDGKKFYASAGGNQKIRVYDVAADGKLTEGQPIMMQQASKADFNPAGIAVSKDGKSLYTANNLDNSVSKIDLATGTVTATTPVGKDPYAVLLSADGKSLYTTNWGESSVSVLDPATMAVTKTIPVGLHPNALAENPATGTIYVANADSDDVTVIDPATGQAAQTISLAPYKHARLGTTPDALALSPDGKTLYVANAGDNDVAVLDLGDGTPAHPARVKGLIPTGWYPTGVIPSPDGKQLTVLNSKGLGAGPNPKHRSNHFTPESQYVGSLVKGTASVIDVPDEKQLSEYTRQVAANNDFPGATGADGFVNATDQGAGNSPIPMHPGQSSPIKHVIYVIKENRTYDQVLGDLGKGNGDPSLTEFGKDNTPNIHKLASQFVTLDNFYSNGEQSESGHEWVTSAQSNDYVEKGWPADYSGRRDNLDVNAVRTQYGRIFANARKSGVSFRDYGEYINWWTSFDPAKGWTPDDPDIGTNYDPNYAGWDIRTSDMTRYAEWKKEFDQFEQNGTLPQLETVYLPDDHTAANAPGLRTPQAMAASNDLALGKLVETVSHSKDWKDTAILVVEDDPQDGGDHVSALRTEALAISPYTQTGKVDSTLYDQTSMVRTVESILGMRPMSQFDASAVPMLNAFTNHPNPAPYTAEKENYPLDQLNGQPAPAQAHASATSSASQTASPADFNHPDSGNAHEHNQEIWQSIHGDSPYPGPATAHDRHGNGK